MTKLSVVLLIGLILALSACAGARERREVARQNQGQVAQVGSQSASILVGNIRRSLHWYVPKNVPVSSAVPIIVLLHGGGGSGSNIGAITQAQGGFDAFAEQNGFIAIYPDALGAHWNDGRETIPHRNDDIGFINAAIDHVARLHRVDMRRVFVAGISNGGMMAQRFACESAQSPAGIAVVAANLPRALFNTCQSSPAVPAIFLLGDNDPLIPFQGGIVKGGVGGEVMSGQSSVDFWVKKNSAVAQAIRILGQTEVATYQARGRTTVAFYKVSGGGHTWPGGTQYAPVRIVGSVSRDFSANQVIWDFFAAQ
jgi:polyhydroxybutyrate depolymerase